MAYLGTWGALMFLTAILGLIILCLNREWGKRAIVLGVIVIVVIPIWLDKLILYQWYEVIPLESSRSPEDWMDFLGSYLGVVGTIVVGVLAYWQTRVNRQQDEEIAKLQEQVTMYQIRPAVYFRDGTMKVYTGANRQQINKNMYSRIRYSICGKNPAGDISSFVYIEIPFQEKGFVPVEKVCINEIKWEIHDTIYVIMLKDDKYAMVGEALQALIDRGDDIIKKDSNESCGEDFVSEMIRHQEYYGTGDYNYEKSHLMLKLQLVNQLGKKREYELNYYIYSPRDKEQLCLKNPHIGIIGEDNR